MSDYEPLAIGGFTPLQSIYKYDPIPKELDESHHKYILGAQANVCTEYITSQPHIEYMTYPRAIALAEVVWTNNELKNYDDFIHRLKNNLPRLKARNVYYADSSIS